MHLISAIGYGRYPAVAIGSGVDGRWVDATVGH